MTTLILATAGIFSALMALAMILHARATHLEESLYSKFRKCNLGTDKKYD